MLDLQHFRKFWQPFCTDSDQKKDKKKELPTAFSSKISVKEKGVIKHQAKIDCSFGKDISHNNNRQLCSRCNKQLYRKITVISTETSVQSFNLEKLLDIIV